VFIPDETPLELFMRVLSLNQDTAAVLVDEGFTTLEELAFVPVSEWSSVKLPPWLLESIRSRARQFVLEF
jgi:N utilization substance protein A